MTDTELPLVPYDSTGDTLKHALRVAELMTQLIHELMDRALRHDRSKIEAPEKEHFDRSTRRLYDSTYGSAQYVGFLADLKPALDHHYAVERHHPEHNPDGIAGMTLVDLIEMLADWRAATERHADGSLDRSLPIQRKRFAIDEQLYAILGNTARHYGWLDETPKETR